MSQKLYEIENSPNGILIGTYTSPTQGCHSEWPWVILSDLAKYSMTEASRDLSSCDSWASCPGWHSILLCVNIAAVLVNSLPISAARCYANAAYAVMRCLCVCPSRSWILSKRVIIFSIFLKPSSSQTILVFPYQTSWQYFDLNSLMGGASNAGGVGTNRDSGRILLAIDRWLLELVQLSVQ